MALRLWQISASCVVVAVVVVSAYEMHQLNE